MAILKKKFICNNRRVISKNEMNISMQIEEINYGLKQASRQ